MVVATPTKSPRRDGTVDALHSAKKALTSARKVVEVAEANVDAALAAYSDTPLACDDDDNKENTGAKSPEQSTQPGTSKSPSIKSPNRRARGIENLTKAIKKMHANDGTDDAVAEVGKEVNTEEDIVFEVKAKPFRVPITSENSCDWTSSMPGKLKLYRHKKTQTTRLVQRNVIGTVKLNLAISGNVFDLERVFTDVKKKGRKAKRVASVR